MTVFDRLQIVVAIATAFTVVYRYCPSWIEDDPDQRIGLDYLLAGFVTILSIPVIGAALFSLWAVIYWVIYGTLQ